MSKNEKNAFTLIELLVVIAILVILASLLLPSLRTARDKAQLTLCMNGTKQFGVATIMYLTDHAYRMPRGAEGTDYRSDLGMSGRGIPFMLMAPYLGLVPVYENYGPGKHYPGGPRSTMENARNAYYDSSPIFRCPAKPYNPEALIDYTVNSLHFKLFHTQGKQAESGWNPDGYPNEFKWPTLYISDLSETILYGENNRHRDPRFFYHGAQFFGRDSIPWWNGVRNTNIAACRMMSSYDETHSGKMAFTAFDGSSKVIDLTEPDDWGRRNGRLTGDW